MNIGHKGIIDRGYGVLRDIIGFFSNYLVLVFNSNCKYCKSHKENENYSEKDNEYVKLNLC
jgi:signal peptidase I